MTRLSGVLCVLGFGAVALLAGCSGSRAAPQAQQGPEHDRMAMPAGDASPAPVTVGREERARLGILVATAEERSLTRDVRLVGRVEPAETAARTVTSRVDGYVERLYVDFTGRSVRRGEVLLDVYSPALVAAQQELLLAVRLRSALTGVATAEGVRNADSLVAAARRRLRFWDVSDDQIAELELGGAVSRTLALRAPSDGVVLRKDVVQGQAVMAGAPLFQIADLSTVWLEADVFESDLAAVRVGQHAAVAFDAYPGETVHGTVAYVYPTVDPASRTGKVRVEIANRGGRIRPGLFGTVRVTASLGVRGVVIPRQAALVTGDRQLVFVEDSAGRFVPRFVTLGVETDSLVEVRAGLRAGERVVATAAFLLDAESNLGAAMTGMAGMDMGPASGSSPVPASRAPAPARVPNPHAGHTGH